ncbi:hypothetical protein BH10PAT1_BH10PAT1_5410 [soil metagenome]
MSKLRLPLDDSALTIVLYQTYKNPLDIKLSFSKYLSSIGGDYKWQKKVLVQNQQK